MKYRSLVGPLADLFLFGGLSILLLPVFWLFKDHEIFNLGADKVFPALTIVFGLPHFLLSYFIYYGDLRGRLPERMHSLLIGAIVPLALFLALGFGVLQPSSGTFGWVIFLMFVLLGWHYVRQVFGLIILYLRLQNTEMPREVRRPLHFHLVSLWAYSLIELNQQPQLFNDISYPHIPLPRVFVQLALAVLIGSGLWALRKYRRQLPMPAPVLVLMVSIYFWLIPEFNFGNYFRYVPIFHALQYLPVVLAFQSSVRSSKRAMAIYFFAAAVAGWLVMSWVPAWLDSNRSFALLAATQVFINIHHYLIDFRIWRKGNRVIYESLIGPRG